MPSAIEVFAGCGGLSTGLSNAGFTILSAIEINAVAAQTYRANHHDVHVIVDDICNIRASELLRLHNLRRGQLDLLAGCSPCQGFSRLRKGKSGGNDLRNKLVFEFLRLTRGLRPKTIFMENVPGLITTDYGMEIFEQINHELTNMGYQVDYKIIDTVNYGVPQFRKRFVLVGSRYRRHRISLPAGTHTSQNQLIENDLRQPWITVRQALRNIPHLLNGGTDPDNPLHTCTRNGDLNLRRIQAVPHDGGSRTAFPDELVLRCHRDYPDGFKDVYGRMRWDYPSPTITGGCNNITKGRFVHPEEDRSISLYEASKLQSFPEGYVFHGNMGEISLQIGNAVPVRLAEAMGQQISAYLQQINGQA